MGNAGLSLPESQRHLLLVFVNRAFFFSTCNAIYLLDRDTDPGHHILDTLEQCIAVIVEKAGDSVVTGTARDGTGDEEGEEDNLPPANTKIIYFMPR